MNKNFFFALLIGTLASFACNNSKEAKVLDFLNQNERQFDKKEYELINLKLIDTIHEDEVYRYPFIPILDENTTVDEFVKVDTATAAMDTVMVGGIVGTNSIDWKQQSYTLGLFRNITTAGKYTNSDNSPNVFLNNIYNLSFKDFESKVLFNEEFKNKLIQEMAGYSYFKGIYKADSVNNNLNIQLEKRKIIYGYLYDLKFRVKTKLKHKKLLFDKSNQEVIGQLSLITYN